MRVIRPPPVPAPILRFRLMPGRSTGRRRRRIAASRDHMYRNPFASLGCRRPWLSEALIFIERVRRSRPLAFFFWIGRAGHCPPTRLEVVDHVPGDQAQAGHARPCSLHVELVLGCRPVRWIYGRPRRLSVLPCPSARSLVNSLVLDVIGHPIRLPQWNDRFTFSRRAGDARQTERMDRATPSSGYPQPAYPAAFGL